MPYYKSRNPIRLKLYDRFGNDIGIPPYDWKASVCAGSKFDVMYEAACTGGRYTNAFADLQDGHVWLYSPDCLLSPGRILIDFMAYVPDDTMPGGIREVAALIDTLVPLTDRAQAPLPPSEPVRIPAGVVQGVTQLVADVEHGKGRLAEALTRQGAPTQACEPLADMADKVLGLRLAVDGEPGAVPQSWNMPGYTDLLNLLRNSLRADLPYCYGIRHGLDRVLLAGADAYLCSDGYFSREGGEHLFTDTGDRWIIYYFSGADYVVTAPTPCIEVVALNGRPQFSLSQVNVGSIRSYTTERYELAKGQTIIPLAPATVALRGVTGSRARLASQESSVQCLSVPDLEFWYEDYLAYLPKFLYTLYLPSLKEIVGGIIAHGSNITNVLLPSLRRCAGGVARSCRSIQALSLPALEEVNGGTTVSDCPNLTELDLPALRLLSGGTLMSVCNSVTELTFPCLEIIDTKNSTVRSVVASNCANLSLIDLPCLKIANTDRARTVFVEGVSAQHIVVNIPRGEEIAASITGSKTDICEFRFGMAISNAWLQVRQGALLRVGIGAGAVTSMDTSLGGTLWDPDSLREFIANLGDNTGGDTKQLKIGAANIAALTVEDIAVATSKNYTIS